MKNFFSSVFSGTFPRTVLLALGTGAVMLPLAYAFTDGVKAQTSYYYVGKLESGQRLIVNLGSIAGVGRSDARFEYLLGDEAIASQAHCVGVGAWTTLSDDVVHYAQSQATREMVRIVCSYLDESSSGMLASSPRPVLRPVPAAETPSFPPVEPQAEPVEDMPTVVKPYEPVEPYEPANIGRNNPAAIQTALVYDPASNVRITPNGQILCSIDTRKYINIYGRLGDWYNTDACGSLGMIHISQIQF